MARRLPFSVKRAEAHLASVDPVLAELIAEHGPYKPRPGEDAAYEWLVRTILFQQLAGSAARAIQRKWYALYSDDGQRAPTPQEVLDTSDEEFHESGVSRQKAGYLRDLAAHVADDRLDFGALASMTDDEVIRALTAVRGVGEWSAHMFMLFYMGRPDVLPVGDYGVRHGVQIAYGLDEIPTPARVREIAAPWAPFRSVGSWYMWRATERVLPKARDQR
jgi:DNA-3-methyladenine glycosylase II